MSDENDNGFPPVQLSAYINGDHYVWRANTHEELANLAEEGAEHVERALKAVNAFKQIVVANSVFSGDSKKGNAGGGKSERSKDSPPPTSAGGGETPHCKHGAMKDLAGQGYKKRWYCTLETDNWRDKCKPLD